MNPHPLEQVRMVSGTFSGFFGFGFDSSAIGGVSSAPGSGASAEVVSVDAVLLESVESFLAMMELLWSELKD